MSGSGAPKPDEPGGVYRIFRVDIKAALKSTGLSNDTIRIYGQVFASVT
jgi:hypothetical protein